MRDTVDLDSRRRFGVAVRALRVKGGYSQEVLGELAEIHRTYLSDLERGRRNVSLDIIVRLASALNVAPGDFFVDFPSTAGVS